MESQEEPPDLVFCWPATEVLALRDTITAAVALAEVVAFTPAFTAAFAAASTAQVSASLSAGQEGDFSDGGPEG